MMLSPAFMTENTAADAAAENREESAPETAGTFRLPASLAIIGESAFEGTNIADIQIPESVQTIESRAFAGIGGLNSAYLPETVENIEDDAFADDSGLTIYGLPGGKTEDFARKANIPFRAYGTVPFAYQEDLFRRILLFVLTAGVLLLAATLCGGRIVKKRERRLRYSFYGDMHALDLCFP